MIADLAIRSGDRKLDVLGGGRTDVPPERRRPVALDSLADGGVGLMDHGQCRPQAQPQREWLSPRGPNRAPLYPVTGTRDSLPIRSSRTRHRRRPCKLATSSLSRRGRFPEGNPASSEVTTVAVQALGWAANLRTAEEQLFIQAASSALGPVEPILQVAHITRYVSFETFVKGGEIALNSLCPRREKAALYFFYGAPFYKLAHKAPHELDGDDVDDYPVGLLVPPAKLKDVQAEVYPFDTGAWSHGLYSPHLNDKNSKLEDFVVHSTDGPTDAGRLVRLLFGSNDNYLLGRKVAQLGVDPAPDAAIALQQMYGARLKADIRRRGIEVVTLDNVSLDIDGVVVIGPKHRIAERRQVLPELDALLKRNGNEFIPYVDQCLFSPTDLSSVILQCALQRVMAQGPLLEAA